MKTSARYCFNKNTNGSVGAAIKILSSVCAAIMGTACVEAPAVCPPVMWAPPPAAYMPPPSPPSQPPPAAPQPAPTPPEDRRKIAVLPIEDQHLFRAERAELRGILASKLVSLATKYTVLPLADVDAKLRPISTSTGARCAFEGEPAERRARDQGWLTTKLLDVGGFKNSSDELWVELYEGPSNILATWTAPSNRRLGLMDRYKASFAALVLNEDAAVLGGLGVRGSYEGALEEGTITVCEKKDFGACDPISKVWKDKAGELSGCFAGEDATVTEVLLEGGAAARCEIVDLHVNDGRSGAREACLCRSLMASSGLSAKAGRRVIRVRFEAADLAGKARPEMRVVESSTNLDSEVDYHSIRTEREGKASYFSLRRLVVDNVDALADPLARCAGAEGRSVMAEIEVREDGSVGNAKILTGPLKPAETACIDKALRRGAFTCTSDGKAAKVRVAMDWPARAR